MFKPSRNISVFFSVIFTLFLHPLSALARDISSNSLTSEESRKALAEELDLLLKEDLQNHPLYINEDSKGNLYRIELKQDKAGVYDIIEIPVTDEEIKRLEADGQKILITPDSESLSKGAVAAMSSSCPVPANFNLSISSNGSVYGTQSFLSTNRPSNTTTQWVVFEFFTKSYRGAGSHIPIVPFFKDALHGWGGFIGDNHGSSFGCGPNATFNSQIEGWYQLPPAPPSGQTTFSWRSKTFNGSNSCGNEMYDGWPGANPYYRLIMHANTGKWVAYQIEKKVGGQWQAHTSWKALQVTSQNWPYNTPNTPNAPPPPLDTSSEGILVGPTPGVTNAIVFVKNFDCGWF